MADDKDRGYSWGKHFGYTLLANIAAGVAIYLALGYLESRHGKRARDFASGVFDRYARQRGERDQKDI
jgi:hypothetical protein